MGNSINVKQTGGNISIGNIVQAGDGSVNSASANISSVEFDRAFERGISDALVQGRQLQRSETEIRDAIKQLEALRDIAKQPSPDKEKGSSILAGIRENFSWAYPVAKDVLSVAWPALLAALPF